MKQVYLILTKDCNLSCDFCIRDYNYNMKYRLNLKDVDLILKEIEENFINTNIVLSGGEPTLHNNFHEILLKVSKIFKNITINTNGTTEYFKTDVFKDFINKYKLTVQISIDGYKELHESIRGLNTYTKSLETIKYLANLNNVSIVVASTVSDKSFLTNFNQLYIDISNIKKIRWDIKRVSYAGRANELEFEYLLNDDWNYIVDEIQLMDIKSIINIHKTFDFNFLDKISNNILKQIQNNVVKNCGSGTAKIYIYPNLDVLACTCYEKYPSGNLKDIKLKDIIQSEQHKRIIYQTIDNKVCNSCRYKNLCNGGCLGSGFSTLGKHNIPDIKCPKIYRYNKENINAMDR